MKIADIFFLIFHTSLIVFNLFGWIWRPFRRANLITLSLTGASWFILGIFYGIGYCPLTEWHFEILRKLGYHRLPDSYIVYLVNRLTGFRPDPKLTGILTATLYFVALACSVYINFFRKKRV